MLFKKKKYMTLKDVDNLRLNGIDTRFVKPVFLRTY